MAHNVFLYQADVLLSVQATYRRRHLKRPLYRRPVQASISVCGTGCPNCIDTSVKPTCALGGGLSLEFPADVSPVNTAIDVCSTHVRCPIAS